MTKILCGEKRVEELYQSMLQEHHARNTLDDEPTQDLLLRLLAKSRLEIKGTTRKHTHTHTWW